MRKILLFVVLLSVLFSCKPDQARIAGKWKLIHYYGSSHGLFKDDQIFVFDRDGFILFENEKAARGEWSIKSSIDEIKIDFYSRRQAQDINLEGNYSFRGDKLTVISNTKKKRLLIEFQEVEEEEK